MSHLPFYQQQVEFITSLARHRLPLFDPFFRFLDYFDTPYFFFVLIPALWLGYSYQWGLRIYYWSTLSFLINGVAKALVRWPRPSTDMPEVGLYHPASFGFPSGGAQMSLFLGGILIYYWRSRAAWMIGSTYMLLISFSRLYLGIHYPIDILGGWLIGAVLLILFIRLKEPLETWLEQRSPLFSLALSLAIPTLILFLIPHPAVIYATAPLFGIGIGTYVSLKYDLFLPPPRSLRESMGRSIIGVAVFFLIIFLWPWDKSGIQSFTAALIMSTAASPLCKWLM